MIPLVVCAADLADGSFREMLRAREVAEPKIPVVVASRRDDAAEYMEAMQLGAFDFIARPYRPSELQWIVFNALRKKRAVAA
jgi:DNA-binding NtrC family response regulator